MRKLWIAWEDDTSIRSRVLAAELDAEYRASTHFTHSRFFGWLRYPVATAQTVWAIFWQRPDLLVVQNPSILLAFEAALLRNVLGFQLVIDLHTPFTHPTGIKRLVAEFLHAFGLRHCSAIVVTNESFRRRVAEHTTRPVLVLPDKVPDLALAAGPFPVQGAHRILYICTFSKDEPWQEVVAAAALLPDDTRIYISGRSPIRQGEVPGNVILTGYLPRGEYLALLHSVDAVMVLTTADDNLVCGGYEGVAAEKPLILSDTAALRALFRRGTVYTANQSRAIAEAISTVRSTAPTLTTDIAVLKREMNASWERRWRELLQTIGAGDPFENPS